MIHSFDSNLAEKYGVNSAIILNFIAYWVKQNEENKTNFNDGCYWTYNSKSAFKGIFGYMTEWQIRKAFECLLDNELIVSGCYNKLQCDRTLWYTLTEKGKQEVGYTCGANVKSSHSILRNSQNALCEIHKTNTINNTLENNNIYMSNELDEYSKNEFFVRFWDAYPRKEDKKSAFKAFKKIHVDEDKLNLMLSAIKNQISVNGWDDKSRYQFIPLPTTWLNKERWNNPIRSVDKPKVKQPKYEQW